MRPSLENPAEACDVGGEDAQQRCGPPVAPVVLAAAEGHLRVRSSSRAGGFIHFSFGPVAPVVLAPAEGLLVCAIFKLFAGYNSPS